jgi:hypothetical protein
MLRGSGPASVGGPSRLKLPVAKGDELQAESAASSAPSIAATKTLRRESHFEPFMGWTVAKAR